MEKKLYRSRTDSKISGVCGGLAVYFGVDATFIRIGLIFMTLAHGIGLLFYIIAWIVIPQRPLDQIESDESQKKFSSLNKLFPGLILIGIGFYFLIQHYWWWNISQFWPVALILGGVYMVVRRNGTDSREENGEIVASPEEGANESGSA